MKKIAFLFFVFLTINCFSQFSKTHYIPPLTCNNNLAGDQYIYISTPSITDVNFKIIENGGAAISGVVNNATPYVYAIGAGDNTQLFTPKTNIGIIQNKGYIIEADDLIYTSVRVNAGLNSFSSTYFHAGGLVSKGNSALGKSFRLGAMLNPLYDVTLLNFASILATENGTNITISNIPNGTVLTNGIIINGSLTFTLNKNESYVLAFENVEDGNPISNSAKMIGALVESDKPVVVNSGSFAGSNSATLALNQNNVLAPTGRDVGFDQIVPFEKTGKEYIFVKGIGTNELERVLLIAHKPQTAVYLNGNSTPFATLINPGDYVIIDGSQFNNGNLYVSTSENVFAYQSIGGSSSPANQNLFFVPPLNCAAPNVVDNIPLIESIGNTTFIGGLNIVTETGATVLINNAAISSSPVAVVGNPNYVRYTVRNLFGNITLKSTKQVYVSYFGTNGAATYGGYYSGFDSKPEIVSDKIAITNSSCIPNVVLKISLLTAYDSFQWYKNDVLIPLANNSFYTPTQPGFYQVKGSISNCLSDIFSDKIPVSECPTNGDNDLANDNIDLDNDNDGITNCTESYGNQDINILNPASGIVAVGTYSNPYVGTVNASNPAAAAPFIGNTDGSFITEVQAGKGFSVNYNLSFLNPVNISLEYITNALTADLANTNAEYIVNCDVNKTITVLNPTNQLLIDTNYDGIYESGVTQFSSFEIRFRLNGTLPLTAGTGTFKFQSFQTNTFKFTHINLLDTTGNKSTFKLIANCVPKDSDLDGIPDQLDTDSDNDGILDSTEAQVNAAVVLSNSDSNGDGIDKAFGSGFTPVDSDTDGVLDYLDLDSDNDGILDIVETGIDTDADGIKNYRDLDSDTDLCNDVIEAGFLDPNGDGLLGGIAPPIVDINGLVTSGAGYTTPNNNYLFGAPIIITSQPTIAPTCELQNATITLLDNGGNNYQWQLSTDGVTWSNIIDNATYSGATTNALQLTSVTTAMNGYKYRVQLNKTGNSCGLFSDETTLTIYNLPIVNKVIIVQCDDDLDAITSFNLTAKNNVISSNSANESFTYYTTLAGANTANPAELIPNPLAFTNTTPSAMPVWSRVVNANGCFRVAELNLIVSVTQIKAATFHVNFERCDDTNPSDTDGFSEFDFHTVTADIQDKLPPPSSNYTIKYYATEANALSEIDEITNPSNYRNTIINKQDIWVRVESNLDNACFGLGPFITLIVNRLPNININKNHEDDKFVCSNLPSFYVKLDAGIRDGSPSANYTYIWKKDNIVLPNQIGYTLDVNTEGIYTVEVLNSSGCSRIRTIKVTASDIAHIQDIIIVDMTDVNTVTVNVTGTGNYEYSLDEPFGPWQDSKFFDNVAAGIHEVYINDKNGCGPPTSSTIAVVGVSKYFTPNNDGYNDYWNVKGVNSNFNTKAIIYIFDRYGKLLKQLVPTEQGWDGTFNGSFLSSDDYWYTIKLDDGRFAKGHFSLKR